MDIQDIFHLFSRAGFGISYREASKFKSRKEAVDFLLNGSTNDLVLNLPALPDDLKTASKKEQKEFKLAARNAELELNIAWIKQMSETNSPFIEKMTLFWHGHFACRAKLVHYALQLNNETRKSSLGSFKNLLRTVSKSAAMIHYLHLQQNRKKNPNEDFARELCELFTLGRDQIYTENDVKEIARAFTGWMVDLKGNFILAEHTHDNENKTIFGTSGNFSGDNVIDMILQKRECAYFICSKIYKFFVSPKINDQQLNELTDHFYHSDYNIKSTMNFLFNSDWFYSKEVKGSLIKSPIELIVGLTRLFKIKYSNPKALLFTQKILEQVVFQPPNVAGWPGDKKWIDSSRLMMRLRLPSVLLTNGILEIEVKPDYDRDPNELFEEESKNQLAKKLEAEADWNYFFSNNNSTLLPESILLRPELSTGAKKLLEKSFDSDKEKIIQILTLPEYQLT